MGYCNDRALSRHIPSGYEENRAELRKQRLRALAELPDVDVVPSWLDDLAADFEFKPEGRLETCTTNHFCR